MLYTDVKNIKVGDVFKRKAFTEDGRIVDNGIMECTYVSRSRHMFRFLGCNDYPDGYIMKVPSLALAEAFFNRCPGVEKTEIKIPEMEQ